MTDLADVVDINPRIEREQIDLTEMASFVGMANVSEQSGSITAEETRPLVDLLKGFTPFIDRDVLVAKITPCFENGKIVHARIIRQQGFGSTEFHVLRPHAEKLDDRYLFHFLRQPHIRIEGERRMTGSAGQRRVPRAFLEKLQIPLLPLPEQRRIAAILDKADTLRARCREAIAKIDQLLQSVFLEIFGDPVENLKRWPVMTLSEVSQEKMANGIFKKKEGYSDKGLPVVWVEELFNGLSLDLSKSRMIAPTSKEMDVYSLFPGDILFCRSSLKLDGIAYNNIYLGQEKKALFECHLIRLRVNQDLIDPVFLNYLLRMDGMRVRVKRFAKTSTMTTIDQKGLGSVEVIVPNMASQIRFRTFLEKCVNHEKLMRDKENRLENLFFSIQQRAFTGAL